MTISGADLNITPIDNDNGYTILNTFETNIVNETKIVLHVIQPIEILDVIDALEQNTINLGRSYKNIIKLQINMLRTKLRSIMLSNNRYRRGLLNVIGTAHKWLFGIMDDDDRQIILQKLDTANSNNHNIVQTMNEQVTINNHFNDSLCLIKDSILDDRKKINNAINTIQTQNSEIRSELLFNEQLIKLKVLENKVDQIIENIYSAKYLSSLHINI